MSWTIEKIFKGARKFGASDIHLVQGVAPVFRVNGEIRISEGEPLAESDLRTLLDEMTTDRQRKVFEDELQLCFSRQVHNLGRYRTSAYFRAGCPEMAIRLCETRIRSAEELGLPPIIEELTRLPNGLVLLTGPTGMGKTTTMRDLETIETALTAAETGHLVLATLHTPDAVQTLQRIYSVFPAEQQNSIVEQLANSLQAVVCQRLLSGTNGKRVLAMEVCIATPAIRKHLREQQPHLLLTEIQMGRRYQMQSFDNSLLELYQRAEITYDVCLSNARDQEYVRKKANGG